MNKKGCIIAGCSILFAIVLGVVIIIGALSYSAYQTAKSYTAAAPMDIPVYEPTAEEEENVKEKVATLRDAINNKKSVEVVFTQNDINTVIATHEKAKELAGNFAVEIKGDVVKATGSLPLKKINSPLFKDRYINGTFSLKPNLKNGFLKLFPVDIEVNGEPLPADFMSKLRQQNIAKEINNDPEKAKVLEKFKSIIVKDGKIIVETEGDEENY